MSNNWNSDGPFHLGVNMAGAVSAGAYTAGVLDFLMEALEQWTAAKADPDPKVPMHGFSLDVFSGASAGGMCAAIASVMVQGSFEHIRNPFDPNLNTTNKFYQSWVNKIDIEPLLQDADLATGKVISLLDSTIIDQIADYALTPGAPLVRPYISSSLTLFLTVTNVRGTPYSLNGTAKGSTEEDVAYYADRLQFETVPDASTKPQSPGAKPLPAGASGGAWPLLNEAAKATGAFPLFLAPRQLIRDVADFQDSPWLPLAVPNPPPFPPHWTLPANGTITTLNIDGGVTNNDPFQLAHDYLALQNPQARLNPKTGALENPKDSENANCAVLTIAPFPTTNLYVSDYDFAGNSSVIGMLPNIFTALLGQSRFLGESLTAVMDGAYSRFVMAPSDAENPDQDALQCGLLSAFGGFFERGFRAHDYQLGRRNCQKFLRDHFCLASANPIIKAGLAKLTPANLTAAIAQFDPKGTGMLPIIPLCGSAVPEVPAPPRATITQTRVGHIQNWIISRLHALAKPLLESAIGPGFDAWAARAALDALISTWGRAKVKDFLNSKLKGVISPD
jgi:hypothetical protein